MGRYQGLSDVPKMLEVAGQIARDYAYGVRPNLSDIKAKAGLELTVSPAPVQTTNEVQGTVQISQRKCAHKRA